MQETVGNPPGADADEVSTVCLICAHPPPSPPPLLLLPPSLRKLKGLGAGFQVRRSLQEVVYGRGGRGAHGGVTSRPGHPSWESHNPRAVKSDAAAGRDDEHQQLVLLARKAACDSARWKRAVVGPQDDGPSANGPGCCLIQKPAMCGCPVEQPSPAISRATL